MSDVFTAWAVMGDYALAAMLVSRGSDPNAHWKQLTFLGCACQQQTLEYVRSLLDNGADPNYRPKTTFSPLSIACYHQRLDLVRLLLERGADPHHDYHGDTPFLLSLRPETCDTRIPRLLVRSGAAPHVTFAQAFMLPRASISLLASEFGLDLDRRDSQGHTLLFYELRALEKEYARGCPCPERLRRVACLVQLGAETSKQVCGELEEPLSALLAEHCSLSVL